MTTRGKEEGEKRMVDKSLPVGKRKNISFQEFSSYSYPEEACPNGHSVRKSPNDSFTGPHRTTLDTAEEASNDYATSYIHRNSTEGNCPPRYPSVTFTGASDIVVLALSIQGASKLGGFQIPIC